MNSQSHSYRFFITASLLLLAILIGSADALTVRDAGAKLHSYWMVMESNDLFDEERWFGQDFQDQNEPPFMHGVKSINWTEPIILRVLELPGLLEFYPEFGLLYLENRCLRL